MSITIQAAMLDHVRRFPDKASRPPHIIWNGLHIMTADAVSVPPDGFVEAELLHVREDLAQQGFDLKVNGWFQLAGGEHVDLLRTWCDPRYEDAVRYSFHSADNVLWVWNVYQERLPNGQVLEEKWTGNAGFWVERASEQERIYHCSPGPLAVPDFEALVFRILISGPG
jgi:hypothetical protein